MKMKKTIIICSNAPYFFYDFPPFHPPFSYAQHSKEEGKKKKKRLV